MDAHELDGFVMGYFFGLSVCQALGCELGKTWQVLQEVAAGERVLLDSATESLAPMEQAFRQLGCPPEQMECLKALCLQALAQKRPQIMAQHQLNARKILSAMGYPAAPPST